MAGGIFISYRREDSQHAAGRLVDRLTQSFGRDRIFMDVDTIEPGLDFEEVINAKVAESFVFLVVIGPGWANAAGPDGRRRLDNPDDLVRLEIEAGLKRDVRVIPVLVDGAPMPSSADLPPTLQSLVRRQIVRLTHDAFGSDADRLIATLARLPGFVGGGTPVGKTTEPWRVLEFSVEQLLKMLEAVPADNSRIYKWPEIAPNKLENARAAASVPPDEEIAVLADMTVNGGAKDSFLIGKRGLYYRYYANTPGVVFLTFKEFGASRFAKKDTGGVGVTIGPLALATGATGDKSVRDKIFDLLSTLQAQIRTGA